MRRVYALAVAALSVYGLADAFASKGSEPAGHNGSRSFVADIVDLPIITEHQTNDTRERLPTAPKATTITVTPAVHEVHLAASARPKNTGIAVARRATRAHTRVKPITPPTDLFPPDYA